MKGVKPLGISGLGLGLLYFVLEAADADIPDPLLWALRIVAAVLVLYGMVGWLIERSAKELGGWISV